MIRRPFFSGMAESCLRGCTCFSVVFVGRCWFGIGPSKYTLRFAFLLQHILLVCIFGFLAKKISVMFLPRFSRYHSFKTCAICRQLMPDKLWCTALLNLNKAWHYLFRVLQIRFTAISFQEQTVISLLKCLKAKNKSSKPISDSERNNFLYL